MKVKWEVKRLGDVCEFDKRPNLKTNLPYIGMEHIESNTGMFTGSTEPHQVKSLTFNFTEEHVLYGRLRPYLNKVLLPTFEGHCSTEIFPIHPKKELDKRYLFHWLLSDNTVKMINATSTGARMPRANMNTFLDFEIIVPPLPEQKRIVTILDEAFANISRAKEIAEKNLANAREVFESYLQSVFANPGAGWVKKPLQDVCVLQRGFDLPTRARVSGDFPLVSSSGISDTHNEGPIKAPGIVTGRSGSIGNIFYIEKDFWPLNTVLYIKDFHGNYPKLVYWLLRHFDLKRFASGSGVPTLNRNFVHNETVNVPATINLQISTTEKIDALYQETQHIETIYQQKLASFEELKKSILQKAFSGELTGAA